MTPPGDAPVRDDGTVRDDRAVQNDGAAARDEVREVAVDAWVEEVRRARDEGWDWFEFLDATDDIGRSGRVQVVCQLRRADAATVQLRTTVPREEGVLPSIAEVFPGAQWAEREAGESFDLTIDGDERPLLLPPGQARGVLRKDRPLAARAATSWPGAAEADGGRSRRRQVPPGVPDPGVWGDRDPHAPAPDAADVAASAAGARSRRGAGRADGGGAGRADGDRARGAGGPR